jgi:hypothetical protein
VITFITGLNHCAIVVWPYAVMGVSGNGFFLFEKVLFLAPIKFACYAELGVVRARKSRNTKLYNNIQDWSCSCTQVPIELHNIHDRMKSRVQYRTGLRHDGVIFRTTFRKT